MRGQIRLEIKVQGGIGPAAESPFHRRALRVGGPGVADGVGGRDDVEGDVCGTEGLVEGCCLLNSPNHRVMYQYSVIRVGWDWGELLESRPEGVQGEGEEITVPGSRQQWPSCWRYSTLPDLTWSRNAYTYPQPPVRRPRPVSASPPHDSSIAHAQL